MKSTLYAIKEVTMITAIGLSAGVAQTGRFDIAYGLSMVAILLLIW